jgi:hypothetical protein
VAGSSYRVKGAGSDILDLVFDYSTAPFPVVTDAGHRYRVTGQVPVTGGGTHLWMSTGSGLRAALPGSRLLLAGELLTETIELGDSLFVAWDGTAGAQPRWGLKITPERCDTCCPICGDDTEPPLIRGWEPYHVATQDEINSMGVDGEYIQRPPLDVMDQALNQFISDMAQNEPPPTAPEGFTLEDVLAAGEAVLAVL